MSDQKSKILVVDDQASMRMTMAAILEDEGYDVVDVEDGYQAIEAAKDSDFDLILMDIKMPGINGVQTFREIKKLRPGVTVVMMTGFAVENLVDEAKEEGAFSVIYKPFDLQEVLGILEAANQSGMLLVVDDRSADRESLSEILRNEGYRVASASEGGEAVDMVREETYDVVLMDIKLPDKDGLETFEEIKEISPDVAVVFITGFVLDDDTKREIDSHDYPIVYKPVDVGNVLTLVRRYVAEKVK